MRELALRLLRVPPAPAPPAGGELRVFRAADNFFRYKQITWLLGQIGAVAGLVGALIAMPIIRREVATGPVFDIIVVVEIFGWIALILQIPFTYAVLKLDFELRWYMVTDRSLRIREGITRVVEKTMTFRNIQNISIRQGPLQRLLGIADLEVRTAGGGGSQSGTEGHKGKGHEDLHVAYFRGVGNAAEIRDLIRERVRRHRDSGLGDPDEPAAEEAQTADAVHAARELLEETRALARVLVGR
ncbi:MAG: PH domain-containing protein [Thermoanaerobaculia bacterium]